MNVTRASWASAPDARVLGELLARREYELTEVGPHRNLQCVALDRRYEERMREREQHHLPPNNNTSTTSINNDA